MKKPIDDRGITRLRKRRSYRMDNPQDGAGLLQHMEEWTPKWNASVLGQVERECRQLAPGWLSREDCKRRFAEGIRGPSPPNEGTAAWLAETILDSLELIRLHRGNGTDEDVIQAFLAGQWYGHLLTKLQWEREALIGERSVAAGKRGGRARLIGDGRLAEVLAAKGSARRRAAERAAAEDGVQAASILRAARRHKRRSGRP